MSKADESYQRGSAAFEAGEVFDALADLGEAAEQGHVAAAKLLGHIYSTGIEVDRSKAKAAKWYTMAAERGDANAREHLARVLPGDLTLEEVRANLARATQGALELARRLVIQPLPDSVLYLLDVGGSNTSVQLENGARKIELGAVNDPLPLDQALEWLWHDGHAAMWVDVNARRIDGAHTWIGLMRSRGFVGLHKALYHQAEGYPPFHVTGLFAPPGWKSVEADGRFKLGWMYDQ